MENKHPVNNKIKVYLAKLEDKCFWESISKVLLKNVHKIAEKVENYANKS